MLYLQILFLCDAFTSTSKIKKGVLIVATRFFLNYLYHRDDTVAKHVQLT